MVLAIGSPFGLAQTVTAGIISQTKRETPFSTMNGFPNRFIQTDAAINRGNSGGPLVNMNGEVIGVNSQIATSTGDYNGIGFALPSNQASYVFQQILANGKVRRGYMGVSLESIKPEFGKVYEMPDLKGAIVTSISDKEGRAAKAGLKVNDVIISFSGQPIVDSQDLISKVAAAAPETEVQLVYLREINNKLEKQTLSFKLGERNIREDLEAGDDTPKKLTPDSAKPEVKPLGLTLEELPTEKGKTNNFEGLKGVLIKEIDPASSVADEKNTNGRGILNEGDLIQRVNRVDVTDTKTFNEVAGKLKVGDAVVLHVVTYNRFTKVSTPRIVSFTIQ